MDLDHAVKAAFHTRRNERLARAAEADREAGAPGAPDPTVPDKGKKKPDPRKRRRGKE